MRRQRIRRAHEPPRRRRRDRERAARPEHASRLGEEQLHVAHVLERLGEEDEIEVAVAERKRSVRLELDEPRVRQPGAGAAERRRGHVGGGELAGVQVRRQAAVATAEVERPVHAAERAHELAQMRRRRPGVLGHELPQLVVVAARQDAGSADRSGGKPEGRSGASAWKIWIGSGSPLKRQEPMLRASTVAGSAERTAADRTVWPP